METNEPKVKLKSKCLPRNTCFHPLDSQQTNNMGDTAEGEGEKQNKRDIPTEKVPFDLKSGGRVCLEESTGNAKVLGQGTPGVSKSPQETQTTGVPGSGEMRSEGRGRL